MTEITIPLRSHDEAILVLGPYDRYAKLLRQDLDIEIFTRRGNLRIKGSDEGVEEARRRIEHLLGKSRKGRDLALKDIESILLGNDLASLATSAPAKPARERPPATYRVLRSGGAAPERAPEESLDTASTPVPRLVSAVPNVRAARTSVVTPRSENQRRYLEAIEKHPLVFGLGLAGTGKTYLAVASAVKALRNGHCRRMIITRPVVEAGERLGFLPGDLQAKLNPYMRGRTLAHAFAILDEGQNTTIPQMKMFLTRLGEGSRMVVTGDPSQSDLDGGQRSGLNDAVARLRGFQDIGVVEFTPKDIVRHPLVEQIVRAYEAPSRVHREGERT